MRDGGPEVSVEFHKVTSNHTSNLSFSMSEGPSVIYLCRTQVEFSCTVEALSFSKTAIVELNLFQDDGIEETQDDMSHDAQRAVRQDR